MTVFQPGDRVQWTRTTNEGVRTLIGVVAWVTPAEAFVDVDALGERHAVMVCDLQEVSDVS